jgi:death-on-curing protein
MAGIDYLSLEDLVEIGKGVLPIFQVRDWGLLESAVARPQSSVFGDDAYPSFAEKVAALVHSIARNHCLIDGNKRLAWSAGRIFSLMNSRDIVMTVDDAEEMILQCARGEVDVPELSKIIERASVELPKQNG